MFFDKACSYAIEKIYVTAWQNINLVPGSLFLVYCMADYNKKYRSTVTGSCVLNEVIHISSADELIEKCQNRCVFAESELRELYDKRKFTTIIKVLYLQPFIHKINYDCLQRHELLGTRNSPQLNSRISYDEYKEVVKLGEEKL